MGREEEECNGKGKERVSWGGIGKENGEVRGREKKGGKGSVEGCNYAFIQGGC